MPMFDYIIHPDSEEFHLFLLWLVNDKKHNDASFIIDVVYSSHKYKNLMLEYKQEQRLRGLHEK